MCTALDIPDGGTWTLIRERILKAIKDREISQVDLWQMPAMKCGFTRRKATRKSLSYTKSSVAEPMDGVVSSVASPAIPGPIDLLSQPVQFSASSGAVLAPENTDIHSLTLAFNESQARQKAMEEAISKITSNQNDVINSVNLLGSAIHPLLKDTHELKNTMKMIKATLSEIAEDRENIEQSFTELEQTKSDLVQEITDMSADNSNKLRETNNLVKDLRYDLVETMEVSQSLLTKTELLDRGQRAHNMIVFGWEPLNPQSTPLEDARRYFTKIGFNLAESFLAYRNQPSLRDGVMRPGVLKITFNSVPTCHRGLEAARLHSRDRSITYYAKQDKTKEQERLKRRADDGVRILRSRNPAGDYRERSGKIAEFSTDGGKPRFLRFHPIPEDNDEIMAE